GAVTSAGTLRGQFTSAVPAGPGQGALAAQGSSLVRLAGGPPETLAQLPGPVFKLIPDGVRGADFLVETGEDKADAYVYAPGAGVRRTASGRLDSLRLFPVATGRPVVTNGPTHPDRLSRDGQVAVLQTGDLSSPVALTRLADG